MVQRADPLYLSPLWASIEGTVNSEALHLGIPEEETLVALWQRGSYREDGKEPRKCPEAAPHAAHAAHTWHSAARNPIRQILVDA